MRYIITALTVALLGGGFFLAYQKNSIEILPISPGTATTSSVLAGTSSVVVAPSDNRINSASFTDIENQKPLPNPPAVIKGVYATGYSAGSMKKVDYLIDLIKNSELNAVVIDIKDYSGYVLYDIQNADVTRYHTKEVQISRVNQVIKKFHDAGIYVIARQTVFQDPVLAKARPDLALKNIRGLATSTPISEAPVWHDNKGLAWMDPASKEVWDYNVAITKDAAARGFDEVNFDYIRFASDGSLGNIGYPFYNPKTTLKLTVLRDFFKYLREQTPGIVISADLFGLTTVNNDDLGIGQTLVSAAEFFDYVSPMVYPSHYASGFIGYKNPASYPYEVVKYSMEKAKEKLMTKPLTHIVTSESGATSTVTDVATPKYHAKLRPWLQDFNLGATYDAAKVRAQITAVLETLQNTPLYDGWLLWNPSNVYTQAALNSKQ